MPAAHAARNDCMTKRVSEWMVIDPAALTVERLARLHSARPTSLGLDVVGAFQTCLGDLTACTPKSHASQASHAHTAECSRIVH